MLGTLIAAVVPSVAMRSCARRGVDPHVAEREIYFGVLARDGRRCWSPSTGWLVLRVRENPRFYQRTPNPLVPGVRRVAAQPARSGSCSRCYLVSSHSPAAIPGIFLPYYPQYVLADRRAGCRAAGLPRWRTSCSGLLCLPLWLRSRAASASCDVWFWRLRHRRPGGLALYFLPLFARATPRSRCLYVILVGRRGLRRAALPAAGDAGRRDRLRRALHRQASRGAVLALGGSRPSSR